MSRKPNRYISRQKATADAKQYLIAGELAIVRIIQDRFNISDLALASACPEAIDHVFTELYQRIAQEQLYSQARLTFALRLVQQSTITKETTSESALEMGRYFLENGFRSPAYQIMTTYDFDKNLFTDASLKYFEVILQRNISTVRAKNKFMDEWTIFEECFELPNDISSVHPQVRTVLSLFLRKHWFSDYQLLAEFVGLDPNEEEKEIVRSIFEKCRASGRSISPAWPTYFDLPEFISSEQ